MLGPFWAQDLELAKRVKLALKLSRPPLLTEKLFLTLLIEVKVSRFKKLEKSVGGVAFDLLQKAF